MTLVLHKTHTTPYLFLFPDLVSFESHKGAATGGSTCCLCFLELSASVFFTGLLNVCPDLVIIQNFLRTSEKESVDLAGTSDVGGAGSVAYTHLRTHETKANLV